jgi:hypothetical protein
MRYEPVQIYETTIQDNSSQSAVTFCIIPARSIPEESHPLIRERVYDFISSELGLINLFPLRPEFFVEVISALLSTNERLYEPSVDLRAKSHLVHQLIESHEYRQVYVSTEVTEFASYLSSNNIIPFEFTPLEAVSYERLIHYIPAGGLGFYIGIVVAGNSPLLFITVPAGIIICGAASGIARGLEEGLRSRIKGLMSRRRSPRRTSPQKS